jgi:hypothetical protein
MTTELSSQLYAGKTLDDEKYLRIDDGWFFLSLAAFLWQERYKSLGVQRILVLGGGEMIPLLAMQKEDGRARILGKSGSEPNTSFFILDQIR